jgi:hypothetical protein
MDKFILYLLVPFFLTACYNKSLSVEDRQALKAIRINPIVKVSSPLYYYTGPNEMDIAIDAAVNAALKSLDTKDKTTGSQTQYTYSSQDNSYSDEPNNEEEAKNLKVFLDNNNIAIDTIVFDELSSALRKAGKTPVTDIASQTTANLNIVVYEHGFYVLKDIFNGSRVVPLLGVWCNLVDAYVKKLWLAHHDVEVAGSPVKAVPLKEFPENAKNIENLWRSAAKIAVDNILGELYPVK